MFARNGPIAESLVDLIKITQCPWVYNALCSPKAESKTYRPGLQRMPKGLPPTARPVSCAHRRIEGDRPLGFADKLLSGPRVRLPRIGGVNPLGFAAVHGWGLSPTVHSRVA